MIDHFRSSDFAPTKVWVPFPGAGQTLPPFVSAECQAMAPMFFWSATPCSVTLMAGFEITLVLAADSLFFTDGGPQMRMRMAHLLFLVFRFTRELVDQIHKLSSEKYITLFLVKVNSLR